MDFKRLQSTIFSNYNRGAFCSGNSTIMQLGAEKKKSNGAVRRLVVPDGGKGREGQNKVKKSHKQEKKQSTGSLGIIVEFPTLFGTRPCYNLNILYFEA